MDPRDRTIRKLRLRLARAQPVLDAVADVRAAKDRGSELDALLALTSTWDEYVRGEADL